VPDSPTDTLISPDGSLKVEFSSFEMRMSHTVCNPRITYIPTGEVLLDFWGSMLDGMVSFDDAGRLHMHVREYPGTQPGYGIVIDPREGTITWSDQQAPPRRFKWPDAKRRSEVPTKLGMIEKTAKPRAAAEASASAMVMDAPAADSISAPAPRRPLPEPVLQPPRHESVTYSDKLGYVVFLPIIILFVVVIVGGRLLAVWTPLSVLPHWIAWWIASGLIAGVLVILIFVAFMIMFRNYKGN
jgi:hypothetical protein